MRMRIVFIALLLGSVLSACGPARTPIPASQPASEPGGDWTIRMTWSGGIMGMMKTIEIHSDGRARIEDQRGNGQSTDMDLTAGQLRQLTELVNSAPLQPPGRPGAVCADCFVYDLEITSGGRTFSAQLNDINLPGSGLEPLIEFLRGLMPR